MEIKVAVKDASVLIDLAYGDLIGHWFALGIETYTTDAVYTEVKAGSHAGVIEKFVDAGLLIIDQISSDDALEWLTKVQRYSDTLNISFADASALICAEDKSALLLTGDRLLRKQAESSGIEVRGVIWVIDMLVWKDTIDFELAANALNEILAKGARLPSSECKTRLENWRQGTKSTPGSLFE